MDETFFSEKKCFSPFGTAGSFVVVEFVVSRIEWLEFYGSNGNELLGGSFKVRFSVPEIPNEGQIKFIPYLSEV